MAVVNTGYWECRSSVIWSRSAVASLEAAGCANVESTNKRGRKRATEESFIDGLL
jgi:hypothetical protein